MNFIIDSSSWSLLSTPCLKTAEISKSDPIEPLKCDTVNQASSGLFGEDREILEYSAASPSLKNIAEKDECLSTAENTPYIQSKIIESVKTSRPMKLLAGIAANTTKFVSHRQKNAALTTITDQEQFEYEKRSSQPVTSGLASSNHITLSRLAQPCGDCSPLDANNHQPLSLSRSESTDSNRVSSTRMLSRIFAGWDRIAPYKTPKTCKKQPPSDGFSGVVMKYLPSHGINSHSQIPWTPNAKQKPGFHPHNSDSNPRAELNGNSLSRSDANNLTPKGNLWARSNIVVKTPMLRKIREFQDAGSVQRLDVSRDYQLDTNIDLVGILSQCPQLMEVAQSQALNYSRVVELPSRSLM
jgi:hypothetical protein